MNTPSSDLIRLIRSDAGKPLLAAAASSSGWKASDTGLRFLDQALQPAMKTFETCAGASTLVFAARRTEHTCFVPDEATAERVRACCRDLGIDCGSVQFVHGEPEIALLGLAAASLDLALLDGFPAETDGGFDEQAIAGCLKSGGLLLIGQVDVWSDAPLRGFLQHKDDWQLTAVLPRGAAYVKRGDARRVEQSARPSVMFIDRRQPASVVFAPEPSRPGKMPQLS